MQRKILYLLPFLMMALASCLKDSDNNVTFPIPSGTFSGEFRIIHLNRTNNKKDTVKAPFSMEFNTSTTPGFKVTSDTTTIHAGSYGDAAINPTYILFSDKTVTSTTTNKVKVHLYGTYPYYYDGSSVFQFYTTPSDTLVYQYDLKKK